MTGDLVNAGFELSGACLTMMSVRRVWLDKGYAGVYLPAVMLFNSWSFWNLWYYSDLQQWWSVAATVLMVTVNSAWSILMIKFGRKI